MRIAVALTLGLIAINMPASELNPKVLNVIGEDARVVQGGNVAKYQHTVWNDAFPWVLDRAITGAVQQQITVEYGDHETEPLTIIIGSAVASASEHGLRVTNLDSTTFVLADQAGTLAAMTRWSKNDDTGELGRKVKRLNESYDSWFLIVKPLELQDWGRVASQSKPAAKLMQMVEEASGGIRLGPYAEVCIEVVLKTPDDAVTLAGLGRWLPGFIQVKDPGGLVSRMVDLAENLSIRAQGSLVTISFVISERKLEDMLKLMGRKGRGEPNLPAPEVE